MSFGRRYGGMVWEWCTTVTLINHSKEELRLTETPHKRVGRWLLWQICIVQGLSQIPQLPLLRSLPHLQFHGGFSLDGPGRANRTRVLHRLAQRQVHRSRRTSLRRLNLGAFLRHLGGNFFRLGGHHFRGSFFLVRAVKDRTSLIRTRKSTL